MKYGLLKRNILSRGLGVMTWSVMLAMGLSGCAHSPTRTQAQHQAHLQQVCAHNQLLQKYDCSLSQVQAAALQGDADAEYALAYLYYYGLGTAQDQSSAMLWMRKAEAQGQPLAKQAMRLLQPATAGTATTHAVVTPHQPSFKRSTGASVKTQAALSSQPSRTTHAATATAHASHGPYIAGYTHPGPALKPKPAKVAAVSSTVPNNCAELLAPATLAAQSATQSTAQSTVQSTPASASATAAQYTLQLVAARSLTGVQEFIQQQPLQQLTVYQPVGSSQASAAWYVAAFGQYRSVQQANQARSCLQQQYHGRYQHSWPRSLHELQQVVSQPATATPQHS